METASSNQNYLENKFYNIVNKNTIYLGIVEQSKEHLSSINRQYSFSACVCLCVCVSTYVLVTSVRMCVYTFVLLQVCVLASA